MYDAPTPTRILGNMVYDAARQRVVYVGTGLSYSVDEWDGSSWTPRTSSSRPGYRDTEASYYDALRRRIVIHGGSADSPRGDLWVLTPTPAAVQRFGAGCSALGRSVPLVEADPLHIGRAAALRVSFATPSSAGVIGLASGTTTVNIGPCQFYLLNPELLAAATTDVTGHAEMRVVVPNVNPLRGVLLHAQSFVLSPSGPLFGLDASAGLRCAIGD